MTALSLSPLPLSLPSHPSHPYFSHSPFISISLPLSQSLLSNSLHLSLSLSFSHLSLLSLPPSLPLSPVFPALKERLGDAKEQVREQGQQLIQQILQNVVSSPQAFLDKLMDACLAHKNWRVKEQGLLCLSRTLGLVSWMMSRLYTKCLVSTSCTPPPHRAMPAIRDSVD